MNKILTLGLIICSCQFANASSINNNQNNIIGENDNYTINNVRSNINNVLTFANDNYKCWFMSVFQLFITALNQSEPDSPIRKTNFAKFVNHLKALKDTSRRVYDRGEQILVNGNKHDEKQSSAEMAKMSHIRPNESNYYSDIKKWKIHDVTLEKTRKSNVTGAGIDLIAELIIWGAKHNWMYDEEKEKNTIESSNKEKITQEEKNRRNDALHLLAQIQDMNSGVSDEGKAFSIILSIFPELKQYFGSYISIQKNEDMLITNAEQITLNNAERKRSAIMEEIEDIKNKIVYKINYTDQFFTDILDFLPNYRINNKQINKDNLTELNNMVQHNNTEIINNVLLLLEQKNTNNSEELYDNINNLLQKNKKLVTPLIIEMQKPENKKTFPNFDTVYEKSLFSLKDAGLNKIKSMIKKINKYEKMISSKNNYETLKLSSFDDDDHYLENTNSVYGIQYVQQNNNVQNSNTEYLISSYGYVGKSLNPAYYFPGAGVYELIGMTLSNGQHAISFVKTGKSDSSWSGIDSNRNANDDNYRLEDINYRDEKLPQNQLVLSNSEYKKLMKEQQQNQKYYEDETNNKFLSKVYKHYGYNPVFLLWKKVTPISFKKLVILKIHEMRRRYNDTILEYVNKHQNILYSNDKAKENERQKVINTLWNKFQKYNTYYQQNWNKISNIYNKFKIGKDIYENNRKLFITIKYAMNDMKNNYLRIKEVVYNIVYSHNTHVPITNNQ